MDGLCFTSKVSNCLIKSVLNAGPVSLITLYGYPNVFAQFFTANIVDSVPLFCVF